MPNDSLFSATKHIPHPASQLGGAALVPSYFNATVNMEYVKIALRYFSELFYRGFNGIRPGQLDELARMFTRLL